MRPICFFNRYHNGDVFAGKGYMQELMRQHPQLKYQHAQVNSPKTMADLPAEHRSAESLPKDMIDSYRFGDLEEAFYVNTWIGCYGNSVIPVGEEHANWPSLYTMWMIIYDAIETAYGIKIERTADVSKYVPETNWSVYNTAPALQFLGQTQRMVLLCNGLVRSTQSNLGTMGPIIDELTHNYPDIKFVCTTKFDTTDYANKDRIFFTDDIFKGVAGGDINEIAFLSTRAEVIVGKNSGPFMFTHIKENIFDPNKAFVSLSHRPSDSYAWNVAGLPCRYYHYSGEVDSNVAARIRQAIDEKGSKSPGQMLVHED